MHFYAAFIQGVEGASEITVLLADRNAPRHPKTAERYLPSAYRTQR